MRKEIEVRRSRKGGTQEERDRSTQYSSLSVLHSTEHPQRFTDLDWEEKGEEGNRGDLGEKKESQKGERVIITLLSKNGY